MSIQKDFIIENGILTEYTGTDTRVVIPEGVHTVCGEAFADRGDVVSVTIPEGVTRIGVGAFLRCRALREISLPDSLAEIGMGAFAYCSSLRSVTVPRNVRKIGCSAFVGCTALKQVDYNAVRCADVVSDGNYDSYTYSDYGNFYDDIFPVFYCCPVKKVNVGGDVEYIPRELFHGIRCLVYPDKFHKG